MTKRSKLNITFCSICKILYFSVTAKYLQYLQILQSRCNLFKWHLDCSTSLDNKSLVQCLDCNTLASLSSISLFPSTHASLLKAFLSVCLSKTQTATVPTWMIIKLESGKSRLNLVSWLSEKIVYSIKIHILPPVHQFYCETPPKKAATRKPTCEEKEIKHGGGIVMPWKYFL